MESQVVGELALQIALAVFERDFEALRATLSRAGNYWELETARCAIRNAVAPLLPEQQQWFNQAVCRIQSGG